MIRQFSGVLVTKIQLQKELKQALEYLHTKDTHADMQVSAASLLATAWRVREFRKARKLREANRAKNNGFYTAVNPEDGQDNLNLEDEQVDGNEQQQDGTNNKPNGDNKEMRTNLLLAGEAGTSGSGTTSIQFEFEPGHKADLMYFRIKHFRNARKQLNVSLTQSDDVVMNQKVESVLALSQALRKELEHHQMDFENVEKMVSSSFDAVAKDISRYARGLCA